MASLININEGGRKVGVGKESLRARMLRAASIVLPIVDLAGNVAKGSHWVVTELTHKPPTYLSFV